MSSAKYLSVFCLIGSFALWMRRPVVAMRSAGLNVQLTFAGDGRCKGKVQQS